MKGYLDFLFLSLHLYERIMDRFSDEFLDKPRNLRGAAFACKQLAPTLIRFNLEYAVARKTLKNVRILEDHL